MEQILTTNQKLKTNLDTNFLKIIAIVAMILDHIGKAFFPEIQILQIIGRIAFPIFAYCIVVGVIHTSSFKNYLIRLGAFAVVSQLPWMLAFGPTWNIFFTLFFSALFVYGIKDKKWICLLISLLAFSLLPLDYGFDTVLLLSSIYLLRDKFLLSLIVTSIILAIPFLSGGDINIFGFALGMQGFAILAIPFIYFNTNMRLNINKYFFYIFYPAHLLMIFLIVNLFNI